MSELDSKFWSGVGYCLEEIVMYHEEYAAQLFFKHLGEQDKADLIKVMKKNNPEIFEERIKELT